MANVKFYRLGKDNPVLEQTYIAEKIENSGRIIFANVSVGNSVVQYIWANGIEYKINDPEVFADLVERVDALESWQVDASANIADLQGRVEELEEEIQHIIDSNVSSVAGSEGEYIKVIVDQSTGDVTVGAELKIADISTSDVEDGLALASDVKQYVAAEIAKMPHFSYVVVEELPDIEEAEEYVIYLVPKDPQDPEGNYYDEWMVVMQPEKHFEKIGDTKVDLSDYYTKEEIDASINAVKDYIEEEIEAVDNRVAEVSTALTSFIETVEDEFDEVEDRIADVSAALKQEVEDRIAADASLEATIEDLSTKVAELEAGTVDSIATQTEYVNIDSSKGDVNINVEVVDATDTTAFPSRGLVTDGYVEERLDVFNWVEVEETENPPVESGVQQSNAPIQTGVDLTQDGNTLAVISTGGDVTIE